MISYIKGELVQVRSDKIIVECQGIGYQIQIPMSLADRLPSCGSEVQIHTYLQVREDGIGLFGFASPEERELFCMLLGVSGIGPKGAMGILSTITPENLRFAVLAGDVRTIQRAPGIGSKTAQRLIIELKDKLKVEDLFETANEEPFLNGAGALPAKRNAKSEAIEALVALGYSNAEAMRAVRRAAKADMDTEEILRAALKNML